MMQELIARGYIVRGDALRNVALDHLRILADIAGVENDPECANLFEDQ